MLHMSTDPLFTVKHPLRGLFMLVFIAALASVVPLSPFLALAGASNNSERIPSPCASQADDSRPFDILIDSPLPITDKTFLESVFSSGGQDAQFEEDSSRINSQLIDVLPPVQGRSSAPTGVAAVSQPVQPLTIMDHSSKSVASPGFAAAKPPPDRESVDRIGAASASTGGPPGTPMALPDATRLITDDREHTAVLSGSIWLTVHLCVAAATIGQRVKATLVSTYDSFARTEQVPDHVCEGSCLACCAGCHDSAHGSLTVGIARREWGAKSVICSVLEEVQEAVWHQVKIGLR
jgi:hypothetical protein